MDKIQSQLIKPFVEKMEKEWQALYDKISQEKSQESDELKPEVQTHLIKLKGLLNPSDKSVNVPLTGENAIHDFCRKSKMELRVVERRWQRHIVSRERVKTRASNQSAKFLNRETPTKE